MIWADWLLIAAPVLMGGILAGVAECLFRAKKQEQMTNTISMSLSQAMRLGAMLRPQSFESYFAHGGSCAVGAAIEARFSLTLWAKKGQLPWEATVAFPIVNLEIPCPACTEADDDSTLHQIAAHLNDDHLWTRERIASWIESIENREKAAFMVRYERWAIAFDSLLVSSAPVDLTEGLCAK